MTDTEWWKYYRQMLKDNTQPSKRLAYLLTYFYNKFG